MIAQGAHPRELLRRGRKLIRLLADRRFRAGLRHGVAAAIEHEAALAGCDFASVIDIGAHRGQFTLLCAGLFPAARIHAFEPQPGPFAALTQVTAGHPRIVAHRAAIGPRAGTAPMHVMRPDDCSSLLAPTARQTTLFGSRLSERPIEVEVAPLEAFVAAGDLARPALLKLDVQGFELDALEGCAALLERFDAVYAECSFEPLYAGQALADEVLAHLRARGFALGGVYNMVGDRRGRAVQADFLWTRRRAMPTGPEEASAPRFLADADRVRSDA
jgi:FkbM family methyltransferase